MFSAVGNSVTFIAPNK